MIFSSSSDDENDQLGRKQFISSFDNNTETAKEIISSNKKDKTVEKETCEERNEGFEQVSESNESEFKKKKWGLDVPRAKKSQLEIKTKTDELPLLLRNRVVVETADETEGFQKDLNGRPDEPTMENYSKIPVSRFGEEMMRLMGWKGPKNDKESKAIQYVPRPERLGLGASMARDMSDLKTRKPVEVSLGLEMTKDEEKQMKRASEPKRKVDLEILASHSNYIGADEALTGIKKIRLDLEAGSKVSIVSGEHSGLAGIIKSSNKDGTAWLIELKINGQTVSVPKAFVKRYDPEANKKALIQQEFKSSHDHLWVCSGLKVKLKSKSFLNGKYYNMKGIIMDVQPDQTCTIRLIDSSNAIVQKVPQNSLETCLPRAADPSRSTVKYLRTDRGQDYFLAPFRILQFDDKRGFAIIQAEDDLETCFEAHYDDICEYL